MINQSLGIIVDYDNRSEEFFYTNVPYKYGRLVFVLDGGQWEEEAPSLRDACVWVYVAEGICGEEEFDVRLANYLPLGKTERLSNLIKEVKAGSAVSADGSQLVIDALEVWHKTAFGSTPPRYLTIGSV